jgi:mannose-6-phosphate isomerase-like protein (cupin superfamily)
MQDAILHETNVTEILYILEGAATLITGGTIPGSQSVETPNGYRNQHGPKIEGGMSRHVSKGDVVIIPGRTPHWWVNLESDMSYLVCRPDPDGKTLALR